MVLHEGELMPGRGKHVEFNFHMQGYESAEFPLDDWVSRFYAHPYDVWFPEDPPVGTQVLNYVDSWDLKGHNEKIEFFRRDPLGFKYDIRESPHMMALEGNG